MGRRRQDRPATRPGGGQRRRDGLGGSSRGPKSITSSGRVPPEETRARPWPGEGPLAGPLEETRARAVPVAGGRARPAAWARPDGGGWDGPGDTGGSWVAAVAWA